jgi:DNA-binding CsgD family transcriptional regulator/sugar-specific transcriptional regulator TrmB
VNDSRGGDMLSLALDRELTQDAVDLYRLAVAHPELSLDEVGDSLLLDDGRYREALRVLRSRRLVRSSLDPEREWDAVAPECAVADLLADEEAELSRRQAVAASVRKELLRLLPIYQQARREQRRVDTVEVVRDVETVRLMLAEWSRRAEHEVRVAHTGGGMRDDGLARSLRLDLPVLRRGVAFRSVLQHSTRSHIPTRKYVSTVGRFGGAVRTVSIVPRRMIVFDGDIAFVPLHGGPGHGAAIISEPSMLNYLITVFEMLWAQGKPYLTECLGSEVLIQNELSIAILRQLVDGAKDEAIAHRLGMSVRTCRRHIATIMDQLGARSRFQAGVLAYEQGLLADMRPAL